jgi:putative oxidoreductase
MSVAAATAETVASNKSVTVSGWSVTAMRMLLSGIFIMAGVVHLLAHDKVVKKLTEARFGSLASALGEPSLVALLSGIALLTGGIALLLGILTRWAATGLIAALIPITITVQLGEGLLSGPLWKNIALFGGLLFFAVNDAPNHSLYPARPQRKRDR